MNNFHIEQFEDNGLAHFAYVIVAGDKGVIVDPGRDPNPFLEYLEKKKAKLMGIFETHPHADFVSAHLELHKKTGATIYVSEKVGADYPHKAFDEGDFMELGEGVILKALYTPGHSPDSISILLEENGKQRAVFTGDSLFIGDVGRPDLREKAGNIKAKRRELAEMMYETTRNIFMKLDDDVLVYPAHGAGSLCGKGMSESNSSTIGAEKNGNYALQKMSKEEFVELLLQDQPFIPKYFPYDVDLNKQGAPNYQESISNVHFLKKNHIPEEGAVIVDARPDRVFKSSHIKGAINIMDGDKFETWLGSIVGPDEAYYLVAQDEGTLKALIRKTAKIGYELNIKAAFVYDAADGETIQPFDKETFKSNIENYTILDVRNNSEVKESKVFTGAINIPLHELRERAEELPTDKPIAVHCAGGYRSAAGSSIANAKLEGARVFDMSESVNDF